MKPTQQIDEYVQSLPEWQAANLKSFRTVIHEVMPDITEDWKWNVPVFFVGKTMLFAMSAFKAHTKYNFLNGASLQSELFNNGLESKKARGIDLREGERVDAAQLKALIEQAVAKA